ncbi:hypothetical protein [Gehongia tenuis]|uniref:Toxin-antitoxin system HicB family antitoxin n=1 Tax=Gehongia tenuis TaxID=2763655 RepID=A0A926D3A7_9FIRM|nr:hypothetical protein [Gehongia tenuis]MBC8530562.1 hypothetical protein [Gehongia tenuis]
MEKFKIVKSSERITSINRTIRLSPESFDRLSSLSQQSGVSFNRLVNQCIAYALQNLEED